MTTKVLRVQANERVDLGDFQYAVQQALQDHARQPVEQLWCNPNGQRTWVLSGFAMTNPSASQLEVTRGVAILGWRNGAIVQYGFLTSEGATSRILDLAGYAAAVHGIWVRFDAVADEQAGRLFWNPAGAGSEYAQTVPTRMSADWALRVDQANPGAEWFQIGTVNPSTMALVDQRDFFFEGKVSDTYANGWGTGTDRNNNRATYGIHDLQAFTEMVRAAIEEIKGGGSTRWWQAGFDGLSFRTGLNVGFEAAVVADRVAVGDANFALLYSGGYPQLWFEGTINKFYFNRATHTLHYQNSDNASVFKDNEWSLDGLRIDVGEGLLVGFASGTPTADAVLVKDTNFGMVFGAGTVRTLRLDSDSYMEYDRGALKRLRFHVNGVDVLDVQPAQVTMYQPFYSEDDVGIFAGTSSNFGLIYLSGVRYQRWSGTANHESYDPANELVKLTTNSVVRSAVGKNGAAGGKQGLSDSAGDLQYLTGDQFGVLQQWANMTGLGSFVLWGLAISYVRDDGPNDPGRAVVLNKGVGWCNQQIVNKYSAEQLDCSDAGSWISGGAPASHRWGFVFLRSDGTGRISKYPAFDGYLHASETLEGSYDRKDYIFVGSFFYYYTAPGTQYVLPFTRQGDRVYQDPTIGGLESEHMVEDTNIGASTTTVECMLAGNNWYVPSVNPAALVDPVTTATGLILNILHQVDPNGSGFTDSLEIRHGSYMTAPPNPSGGTSRLYAAAGGETTYQALSHVEVLFSKSGVARYFSYVKEDHSGLGATRWIGMQRVGYLEPLNRVASTMA